jgi:hypothetical protein
MFAGKMMFVAEGCQGAGRMQNAWRKEKTEDLQKKQIRFVASHFFYKSLFTYLYSTMTASISCLNFSHFSLKRSTS